jgi:hypothetical protein
MAVVGGAEMVTEAVMTGLAPGGSASSRYIRTYAQIVPIRVVDI